MFFFRNKHMMCDFGTGNNNKLNWVLEDKQELIDIIETIYRGAKKGRGLVVSPKGESTLCGRDSTELTVIQITRPDIATRSRRLLISGIAYTQYLLETDGRFGVCDGWDNIKERKGWSHTMNFIRTQRC
jgi:hypothetical protein